MRIGLICCCCCRHKLARCSSLVVTFAEISTRYRNQKHDVGTAEIARHSAAGDDGDNDAGRCGAGDVHLSHHLSYGHLRPHPAPARPLLQLRWVCRPVER